MSSFKQTKPESSLYLDDTYYQALLAWRDAASEFGEAANLAVVAECAAFIHREARLLDSRRFDDWLELFTHDCVYWVPAAPLGDPRYEVTISFDDRRRMEDRIIRFQTGFAHNQEPNRRMRRLITNVEAWEAEDGRSRRIMANEHVFEARTHKSRSDYVVGLDYWLVRIDNAWKIKVKRALLINSEDGLEAPTIL